MGRRLKLRAARAAPVPDHLRCTRSDGRQWRCPLPALGHVRFCRHHYLQSRRNVARHKTAAASPARAPPQPPEEKGRRSARGAGWEAAMMEELVRVAVRRRMEERERRRRRPKRAATGEVTRDLPNGVMAIAPPGPSGAGNAGPAVDWKLGLDGGSFLRRCFRSKNAEPAPIGSQKRFPCGRGLGRGVRRICHRCQEKAAAKVQCSACRKFFCAVCIKKWYHEMSELEVQFACPVCRGICSCKACMATGREDQGHEEFTNNKNEVIRSRYAHHLICKLLPTLKHINREQRIELEIEANNQGRRFSGIQLQVAECSHNGLFNCGYCETSIAELHRCCSRCSYRLCLSCCQEIRGGSIPGVAAVGTFGHSNRRKTSKHVARARYAFNQVLSSEQHPVMPSPYGPWHLSEQTLMKNGNSIACPPKVLGGCGDGILNLEIVLPFGSIGPLRDWKSEPQSACGSNYPKSVI